MISFKQTIAGILGNFASLVWFLPLMSNFLHKLRGVNFKNFLNVYIAKDVLIDNRYPNEIHIGSNVVLASRSVIMAHSFVPKNNKVIGNKEVIKSVYIGNNTFIGACAIILPGTILSEGCYVAAGSIVSGKFEKNCLIAGNPAIVKRKIKS